MPLRRRFSRSSRQSGRPRRGVDWGGGQVDAVMTPGQISSAWLLDPSFMAENFVDPTIVRLLMSAVVRNTVLLGASAGYLGIGIIAWDSPDLVLPSAVPAPPPDPLDARFDWMLRFVAPYPGNTPANTLVTPNTEWHGSSRAMRRLGNQTGLLLVLSTDSDLSASVAVDVRYAIKE